MESRSHREIQHGRWLAGGKAEKIWGWDTPAGRLRASRRAGLLIEGAGLAPGMSVLEIGCGTGAFTGPLAAVGIALTAVDISPDLLALAKVRISSQYSVRFIQARFEELDPSGRYDAVVGSSVLHHLDLDRALASMKALLKPGGRFCFTEPNLLNPQIALQKNIPWIKRAVGDSPDETAFRRGPLHQRLMHAGFDRIAITAFDWLHPATPPQWLSAVDRIGSRMEQIPILREFAGSLWIRGAKPNFS